MVVPARTWLVFSRCSRILFTRDTCGWFHQHTSTACRIFEDSGFSGRLRSVPEDDEGIDIVYLEQELQKAEKQARLDGNDKPVEIANMLEISELRVDECLEIQVATNL